MLQGFIRLQIVIDKNLIERFTKSPRSHAVSYTIPAHTRIFCLFLEFFTGNVLDHDPGIPAYYAKEDAESIHQEGNEFLYSLLRIRLLTCYGAYIYHSFSHYESYFGKVNWNQGIVISSWRRDNF